MIKYEHTLPAANFVGSRNPALLRLCEGRTVLHLGFVDEGLIEDRLRHHNWLHAELTRVASRVVGVDISGEGVQRAKEVGFSDCYAGDVEKLGQATFPRLHYDVILAADIIEHVANPGLFLSELQAVASEDTVIVITTPNALSIKTFFFPLARTEAVHSDHNFYYSPTTLTTLLRKYGFLVTGIDLYSGVWVQNRQKSHRVGEKVVKSLFTAVDAVLRYSVVLLFPYYSEGMLIRARKMGTAPAQDGSA
jgi:SAM-dependent methyltransferase